MRFYQFVLKNVFRRRVRSALTLTGMAMAVGTVVALVGIADGFSKSLMKMYQDHGVDLIVCNSKLTDMLGGTMPEAISHDIAALDGVAGVAPGLVHIASFENLGLYNINLQGVPPDSFIFRDYKILQGELLSEKFRGKRGIMLGRSVAEAIKKKVGERINVYPDEEYQVVCIFETGSPIENAGMVILLEDMQKLENKPGLITGCSIKLKTGLNMVKVRDQVRKKDRERNCLEVPFEGQNPGHAGPRTHPVGHAVEGR